MIYMIGVKEKEKYPITLDRNEEARFLIHSIRKQPRSFLIRA
jgi:hypothetical protein